MSLTISPFPQIVDPQTMKLSSDRELSRLRRLLDNVDKFPTAEETSISFDRAVTPIFAELEYRRLAIQAARRVSRDPDFRKHPRYVEFWIKNLKKVDKKNKESITKENTVERRNQAVNGMIMATLSEIVNNFPTGGIDESKAARCMRTSLDRNSFKAVAKLPGLFKLNSKDEEKFNVCLSKEEEEETKT